MTPELAELIKKRIKGNHPEAALNKVIAMIDGAIAPDIQARLLDRLKEETSTQTQTDNNQA